jgi:hypothetical protein
MKKLIAGLFAAILTTAGLVAVTSTSPANAACTSYVCNDTQAKPKAPRVVKQGKPAKVAVQIQTRGNVKATGTVTVTITGPGGYKRTVKATYTGSKLNLNLGKLAKPGIYTVSVTFKGNEGFDDSKAKTKITVKKSKKG